MARDYKHRLHDNRPPRRSTSTTKQPIGLIKSMLISTVIIGVVVVFAYGLSSHFKKNAPPTLPVNSPETTGNKKEITAKMEAVKPDPNVPQFDFYTILPAKEVVVPEYEIQTRTREESVGTTSVAKYVMQVGSFKTRDEADGLKEKLAEMGLRADIQMAKVGNATWFRVRIGPYGQISNVNAVRHRLRENGIDSVVTQID